MCLPLNALLSCTHSLGGTACVHTQLHSAICSLSQQQPTHSTWGSPACGYHSVLLAPHTLQGSSTTWHIVAPTLSAQGRPARGDCSIFLALHSVWKGESCVHVQHHPAVLAGSISGWRGLLYACYGALLFLLDLAAGGEAVDTL